MGAIARFLLALNRLARTKGIKIEDAYKFAKQEFGEITPLLRKQIQNVFNKIKKPVVGKPGKKEGTILPFIKETKEPKGLEALDVSEFDESMGDVEQMLNPYRPKGGLDQATGITRALARRILDKKGIKIGKKDPIDVFTDTFGEAINDVNNLAEEMIEIDARGGGMKDMDQMLEIEGLFDIEIPANPNKGLTDEEMLELMKKTEEEEIIKNFDPKGRKPNAGGGLMSLMNRDNYQTGGDVAYDATNKDIYGSSAITVTPDTVMGPGGNQIQDKMGKPEELLFMGRPVEGIKIDEDYKGPPLQAQPIPGGSIDLRRGEIDRPTAGGNNNQMGILPVMPDKPAQPTMSDEDIQKGFAEYIKQNPDIMSGPSTQAIVNLTLPGGTPISFRSGAGAYALRQYLKSIGMEAGPGIDSAVAIDKMESPQKLEPLSPLAANAYSKGGSVKRGLDYLMGM